MIHILRLEGSGGIPESDMPPIPDAVQALRYDGPHVERIYEFPTKGKWAEKRQPPQRGRRRNGRDN